MALTNWPTATAVHLITYKKKTDGTIDRSTLCLWKGIVSGTTIGTLTLKGGTDAGNAVGDFVELAPTSAQWQDLYDGLTQTLNIDGTLKSSIVTTAKINDSAVTPSKLATGAGTAKVATGETTTSTSYTDLTTTTDAVIVTIGDNGLALISISAYISNTGTAETFVGVAVSGASTVSASDADALDLNSVNTTNFRASSVFLMTGLNAGSTTFKMKYRTTANTATFKNRVISVVPL